MGAVRQAGVVGLGEALAPVLAVPAVQMSAIDQPGPPPLEASACFPPAASARRHRFADIRDTRNRFAASRSLAPASIRFDRGQPHPLAADRSAAVSPPPSGYLMPPGLAHYAPAVTRP
jgi:hypothetical protein